MFGLIIMTTTLLVSLFVAVTRQMLTFCCLHKHERRLNNVMFYVLFTKRKAREPDHMLDLRILDSSV